MRPRRALGNQQARICFGAREFGPRTRFNELKTLERAKRFELSTPTLANFATVFLDVSWRPKNNNKNNYI